MEPENLHVSLLFLGEVEDREVVSVCRAVEEVAQKHPSFLMSGRPALYYVRAVEEPTPAVNAGGLRCERDAAGSCVRVHPCFGDYRTPFDDDCLAPNEERAWSSPIYLDPAS